MARGSISALLKDEDTNMTDEIIGMADMMAVYEVTDRFAIDRETISVPLGKEGTGSVAKQPDGGVEIIVPATLPTRDWLPTLDADLEKLGFTRQSGPDEEA